MVSDFQTLVNYVSEAENLFENRDNLQLPFPLKKKKKKVLSIYNAKQYFWKELYKENSTHTFPRHVKLKIAMSEQKGRATLRGDETEAPGREMTCPMAHSQYDKADLNVENIRYKKKTEGSVQGHYDLWKQREKTTC